MITITDYEVFELKARLATFHEAHQCHELVLSDHFLEECLHLIKCTEYHAQLRLKIQHEQTVYLGQWQAIFLTAKPPSKNSLLANSCVIVKEPLSLYQCNHRGEAKLLASATNSIFLQKWLSKLALTQATDQHPQAFDSLNNLIYQHDNQGLNAFNRFISSHKGVNLLKSGEHHYLAPPTLPTQLTKHDSQHPCLGTQAIARVIDQTLKTLAQASYIDNKHFADYFMGALSLSLKTLYQAQSISVTNEGLANALTHITQQRQNDKYLSQCEATLLSHINAPPAIEDQLYYPPIAHEVDRSQIIKDDDLGCLGQQFMDTYRKKRRGNSAHVSYRTAIPESITKTYNHLTNLTLAYGHTAHWRMVKQWQYINQEITQAAAKRNFIAKLIGHKNSHQHNLAALRRTLLHHYPELELLTAEGPSAKKITIHQPTHSEQTSTARTSFDSDKSPPSQDAEHLATDGHFFRTALTTRLAQLTAHTVVPLQSPVKERCKPYLVHTHDTSPSIFHHGGANKIKPFTNTDNTDTRPLDTVRSKPQPT